MTFSRAHSTTRHLTQEPIVLSVKRSGRQGRVVFFGFAVLLSVGLFVDEWRQWSWLPKQLQLHADDTVDKAVQWRQSMQQERDELQAEIERLLLEQKIEAATRQELERQIAALQAQIKDVELKLNFVQLNQPSNRQPSNR